MARHAASAGVTAIVAVLAVASASAQAPGSAVYKCSLQDGRVLYSDVACKGATVVDADGGTADPSAVARLERDSAAFNAMMWERRLAEERAALARQASIAQQAPPEPVVAEAAGGGWHYFDPGYAYAVVPNAKRHANKHQRAHPRAQTVPAKPSPLMTRRVPPR
jgi:hypothetical protein